MVDTLNGNGLNLQETPRRRFRDDPPEKTASSSDVRSFRGSKDSYCEPFSVLYGKFEVCTRPPEHESARSSIRNSQCELHGYGNSQIYFKPRLRPKFVKSTSTRSLSKLEQSLKKGTTWPFEPDDRRLPVFLWFQVRNVKSRANSTHQCNIDRND
jgi:hypothetical protein